MTVLDFFTKNTPNPQGLNLEDILGLSNFDLESSHDVIQWMFPLHEVSMFNFESPIIDQETSILLQSNDLAKENVLRCLARFLVFLGFNTNENCTQISLGDNIDLQKNWQTYPNHNLLRITRVIRSLRLFGLDEQAKTFYNAVKDFANERTFSFWLRALEGNLFDPIRS